MHSVHPYHTHARGRSSRLATRVTALLACLAMLGTIACSGDELPPEISAVSVMVQADDNFALLSDLLTTGGPQNAANLPADSDYAMAQVRKFVDIEALNLFQILSTVFDAIRQTHHTQHMNDGWYRCLVAFNDEGEGGENQTSLQEWFVQSETKFGVVVGFYNRLQGLIVERDEMGEEHLIRIQADIYTEPTLREDGSLADMGAWDLRASFDGEEDDYFFATSRNILGMSRITIQDHFTESFDGGPEMEMSTRAILIRSDDRGFGVAEFPDWDACWGPSGGDCSSGPPNTSVTFAYNERYLTVAKDGEDAVSFDRADAHEIVHRYQLYTSGDGQDINVAKNFGFPVRGTQNNFGWYGAWQDRHEVWMDGQAVASGVVLTREDAGEGAPTYTTRHFDGSLTRVSLAEGNLDPLIDVPVETWVFDDLRLRWNEGLSRWDECIGDDGMGGCESIVSATPRLPSLEMSDNPESRRHVWINGCLDDGMGWTCNEYVYDTSGTPGFYQAVWNDSTGRKESTGVPLDTGSLQNGFELWVGIDGQIFIEYTGEFSGPTTTTGWVERELVDFAQENWAPIFGDASTDREFMFEVGREYYVNKRGGSLRVTRVAENGESGDYRVFTEVHRVAKPAGDLDLIFVPGTLLENGWDGENGSSFALNTDSTSANYLMLEYVEVSDQDEIDGHTAGDLVEASLYGLRIVGDTDPMEVAVTYNWEYQGPDQNWGGVTYLLDTENQYVLLDAALHFVPIALPTKDDLVQGRTSEEWSTFAISYDGWLQGLPDTRWELQRNGTSTDGVASVLASNIRIPDGVELTDVLSGDVFHIKAIDVGIFLGVVTAFPNGTAPDLTSALNLDLESLPVFVAPDIEGGKPEDAELLYVEGVPVAEVEA